MPSYTEVSVSSYNASPPADTGAATEDNRMKWSTIKTKLASPLNTAIGSLDDNIAAAITTITTNLATATANLATATANSGLTTLNAPQSTVGIFAQTAAPTGWTKGATHNDKALRLVSGAVSSGGSTAFSSVLAARTITSSNMPAHTHSWSASASTGAGTIDISGGVSGDQFMYDVRMDDQDNINNGGSALCQGEVESRDTMSGTVSVSGTTGSQGSGTAMDFAVRYVDVIFATKD